jgi:hypothetical protein
LLARTQTNAEKNAETRFAVGALGSAPVKLSGSLVKHPLQSCVSAPERSEFSVGR